MHVSSNKNAHQITSGYIIITSFSPTIDDKFSNKVWYFAQPVYSTSVNLRAHTKYMSIYVQCYERVSVELFSVSRRFSSSSSLCNHFNPRSHPALAASSNCSFAISTGFINLLSGFVFTFFAREPPFEFNFVKDSGTCAPKVYQCHHSAEAEQFMQTRQIIHFLRYTTGWPNFSLVI